MGRKSNIKLKSLTIPQQAAGLVALYPEASCNTHRNRLTWLGTIHPTPMSLKYDIRVEYTLKRSPRCFVITPLTTPPNKTLPHVYCHKNQRLCLFIGDNWNSSMSIAHTIIPWASEWLLYYELWVSTRKWLGGGVHPQSPKTESITT